jgi:hypothetical protein
MVLAVRVSHAPSSGSRSACIAATSHRRMRARRATGIGHVDLSFERQLRVGTASSSRRKRSPGWPDRVATVLRPQYLVQRPFEALPVAGVNDCLVSGSASAAARDLRQEPLHTCRSIASRPRRNGASPDVEFRVFKRTQHLRISREELWCPARYDGPGPKAVRADRRKRIPPSGGP